MRRTWCGVVHSFKLRCGDLRLSGDSDFTCVDTLHVSADDSFDEAASGTAAASSIFSASVSLLTYFTCIWYRVPSTYPPYQYLSYVIDIAYCIYHLHLYPAFMTGILNQCVCLVIWWYISIASLIICLLIRIFFMQSALRFVITSWRCLRLPSPVLSFWNFVDWDLRFFPEGGGGRGVFRYRQDWYEQNTTAMWSRLWDRTLARIHEFFCS